METEELVRLIIWILVIGALAWAAGAILAGKGGTLLGGMRSLFRLGGK